MDRITPEDARALRQFVDTQNRLPKLDEQLALTAPTMPPADVAAMIAASNASLPLYRPTPGSVRYAPQTLNAAGYTMMKGPLKGRVVVATGSPYASRDPENDLLRRQTHNSVPNTLAHESLHQRFDNHGIRPIMLHGKQVRPEAIGNDAWFDLMKKMRTLQPDDQYGPYWGLHPSTSAEEQLASIFGYEGSLPKGKAITETPVGQALFGNQGDILRERQDLKDYYFSQVSHPYGGLWEGQTPAPSMAAQAMQALQMFLQHRGIGIRSAQD